MPNRVPIDEVEFNFSRSGGAGGQNVNKTETKVQARWNIDRSQAFSPEEKAGLLEALAGKLTDTGDLVVTAQDERSQEQNRERALARLNDLVDAALVPQKPRIPTKPTPASRRKRLEIKSRRRRTKQLRQSPEDFSL